MFSGCTQNMDNIGTRLRKLNHDQLVEVVYRLLEHRPELESLVFLPLRGERHHVDAKHIESQVENIIDNMEFHWQASSQAEIELRPVVGLGKEYLENSEIISSAIVFRTVIAVILPCYEGIYDNESEISDVVIECIDGLGKCLSLTDNASERERLLKDIFEVFRWDVMESGGYGMGDSSSDILIQCTNSDERIKIAGWVQDALSITEGVEYGAEKRRDAGQFILKLTDSINSDDAELEKLYIKTDMWGSYFDLLLKQERSSEAIKIFDRVPIRQVYEVVQKLSSAGFTEQAVNATMDHICILEPFNRKIDNWLASKGCIVPDNLEKLRQSLRFFQSNATVSRYKQLRDDALTLDRWLQVLQLIDKLDQKPRKLIPIRARLHADSGRIDKALSELSKLKSSQWRSTAKDIISSIEEKHPDVAIELCKALLVDATSRSSKYALKQAQFYRGKVAALKTRV